MTERLAIGVDLGGTNIRSALVDAHGTVHHRIERPTNAEQGPDAILGAVAQQVADTMAGADVDRARIEGIGLGAPGPLSQRNGIIYKSVNLPGWIDVPIRDQLARRTGLTTILENDANAAAFGEYWAGPGGRSSGDLVMFTLGTGVGGGIIINGRPLHGRFENAAELGHTLVVPDGRPCECGQRGCLEQYASATAVVRRVQEALESGQDSVLVHNAAPINELTCEQVVQAVRDADPLATQIWDDACRFLATACVIVQHTLNPARVVFGGGMSQAGSLLIDRITTHFNDMRWHLMDDFPKISLAELGGDAGVIGAATLLLGRDT